MKLAVLYINGLGTGIFGRREQFLVRHWQKAGVAFVCAGVNWYDGKSLDTKIRQVDAKLKAVLATHKRVILLGSSAGASLALHVFMRNRKEDICLVSAHGRLRKGASKPPDYRTLEWAAHLTPGSPKPKSQAFYDSVITCERDVLPGLTKHDLKNILVLKPLADFVVPISTMTIPGQKQLAPLQ